MEYNLELFKNLSKEVLYYMPKQLNFRCPRADAYLLYDLDTPREIKVAYNTGFPKWREVKHEIFSEIRWSDKLAKPKRIIKVIMFKHNDRSFSIPMHTPNRKHLYFMVNDKPDIIISGYSMDKNVKHMCYPENDYGIIPFGKKGTAWKKVYVQKTNEGSMYSIGNLWTSILYPTKDTVYFYVETDI